MSITGGKKEGDFTKGFSTTGDSTLSDPSVETSASGNLKSPSTKDESSTEIKSTFVGDSGSSTNMTSTNAHDDFTSMKSIMTSKSEIVLNKDGTGDLKESATSVGGDIAISLFNEVDITEYSTEIQEYITEVNRLATQPAAQPAVRPDVLFL